MGFTPTETIWFNGKLVPWGDAKVHVLAHGLQYGTGVFEGMKSYPTADGPAIFRLDAHLERFYKSAELYDLAIPYTQDALAEASLEVVRANRLEASYLRPVAFFDAGDAERLDEGMPGHRGDCRGADRQVPRRTPTPACASPSRRSASSTTAPSRPGPRPAASTSTRRAR